MTTKLERIQAALDAEYVPGFLTVGRDVSRLDGPWWYLTGPGVEFVAHAHGGDSRYPYPEPRYRVRLSDTHGLADWRGAAQQAVRESDRLRRRAEVTAAHPHADDPTEECDACVEALRYTDVEAYLREFRVAHLLSSVAEVVASLRRAADDIERDVSDYRERPRPVDRVHLGVGWADPAVDLASGVLSIVTQVVNTCRLPLVASTAASVAVWASGGEDTP